MKTGLRFLRSIQLQLYMRRRRHSRKDAVGKHLFADLYQGALRIKDDTKCLVATMFVLLTGRLKMRMSEAMHFHEGWYKRKYGLIEIPEFEPCACQYCWTQAQQNHSSEDDYDNAYQRFIHERYRTKNRRTRFVPVAWCPRIIACIEEYLDEVEVFQKSERTASRLLDNHILKHAEHFEPGDIDWRGMRATGDTFWAFSDLNIKERAEIGGHREAELGTYSGSSPIELVNAVRQAKGLEPLAFPDYDPVTTPAKPHPNEPFPNPLEVDPMERYDPLTTQPVFNPRTEPAPANTDFNRSDFNSMAITKKQPSMEEVRALIDRFETRLEGDVEETVDPYKNLYGTKADDESSGPGQSILDNFSNATAAPLLPLVYGMIKSGQHTKRRLEKECVALRTEYGALKNSKEVEKGAVGILSMIAISGILAGSTGTYIDPINLQMSFPTMPTTGLAVGSSIGVGHTLWVDYKKRVEDISLSEWLLNKIGK